MFIANRVREHSAQLASLGADQSRHLLRIHAGSVLHQVLLLQARVSARPHWTLRGEYF